MNVTTTHMRLPFLSKELIGYSELLRFNYELREVFLCHLADIFADFETFVVPANSGADSEETGTSPVAADTIRCGLEAFDKVGFLSDCPETHMSFLR